MCGPSAEEKGIQSSQIDFMKQLQSENSSVFNQSQGILNQLNGMFSGILAKGPSQEGFAPGEKDILTARNIDTTAQSYDQAKRGLQQTLATQGGGNQFVPSGVNDELQGELAQSAAATKSSNQNQIELEDYETGRQNFFNAAGELGSAAGLLNPTGYAGVANNAGSDASTTAGRITSEAFAPYGAVIGALGGVAGAAAGGWTAHH